MTRACFAPSGGRNRAGAGNPRTHTISSPLTTTGQSLRSLAASFRSCNNSLTFFGDLVCAGQNRSPGAPVPYRQLLSAAMPDQIRGRDYNPALRLPEPSYLETRTPLPEPEPHRVPSKHTHSPKSSRLPPPAQTANRRLYLFKTTHPPGNIVDEAAQPKNLFDMAEFQSHPSDSAAALTTRRRKPRAVRSSLSFLRSRVPHFRQHRATSLLPILFFRSRNLRRLRQRFLSPLDSARSSRGTIPCRTRLRA